MSRTTKYRVVLDDDHDIVRAGTKSLIEKEPDFKVVAEAQDGEQLLDKLKSLKCDLVIVDLSMPNMDGLTALEKIHKEYPAVKILVLSMLKDHEHFKRAMARGALGYLLKEEACFHLVTAMKTVLKGRQFVSPSVEKVITDRFLRSADEAENACADILTKRERQVLQLIAKGLANKTIASKLKISIRTVENHRLNLTNKLGIKSTAGLVKYAIAKGLN